MPKGGHFGLWKPVPKDIYKSRWKMFYKRCPRKRAQSNDREAAGPHMQPESNFDGVPAPWKLDYSIANFSIPPPDAMAFGKYATNLRTYMEPWEHCKDVRGRAAIIQALDPGSRGSDSGLGRFQCYGTKHMRSFPHAAPDTVGNPFPSHIQTLVKDELERVSGFKLDQTRPSGKVDRDAPPEDERNEEEEEEEEDRDQERRNHEADRLKDFFGSQERNSPFMVRRLASLIHEHEIVWKHGQRRNRLGRKSSESAADSKDRGHFPFADEQASLIDDLGLAEILRVSHRTASRRHPKWKEIQYEFRRKKQSFLRRRQMALDEAKASMGVIKQSKVE